MPPLSGLIVRYGPAPLDTADSEGNLHADFTDFVVVTADGLGILPGGAAGAEPPDPSNLVALAVEIWKRVCDEGHGHMLIGFHSGFEYVLNGPSACGMALGRTANGTAFAPRDYVPVFVVTRHIPVGEGGGPQAPVDLYIDYREAEGPGDLTIRPQLFPPPAAGGASPPPTLEAGGGGKNAGAA